jgi:putative transcriptional regulator
MGRKAFDKVAEGLNEALAIARGVAKPARLYIPAEIDIKAIRANCRSRREISPRVSGSR